MTCLCHQDDSVILLRPLFYFHECLDPSPYNTHQTCTVILFGLFYSRIWIMSPYSQSKNGLYFPSFDHFFPISEGNHCIMPMNLKGNERLFAKIGNKITDVEHNPSQ